VLEEPYLFRKIMIGDETWIFHFKPGNKIPKSLVEKFRASKSIECANVKIEDYYHADLLFF
jgi:hypothetical protein